MTNEPGMLNFLRLVICENGIITPYVRNVPNVHLAADFDLKVHTFFYSVPSLVRVNGTDIRRVFIPKD